MAEHINPNRESSQDVDWSASTTYGAGKYLGYGGIWSVPSFTTKNTLYVSKNGSDSTGTVETPGLPFLTITAARTAAIAYYDGSSPTRPLLSATQRVLIVVYPGVYNEAININTGALGGYIDYDLTTAIIDLNAGAAYTIDDNNTASNCIIYGNAQIKRSTAGTLGGIAIQHINTDLKVYVDSIISTIGLAIEQVNGKLIVDCNYIQGNGIFAIQCAAGTQTINVKKPIVITGGAGNCVSCYTGTQTINGNIDATLGIDGASCTGGTQIIKGNIIGATRYGANVATTGTQIINGDITLTSGTQVAYCAAGGTQIINNSRLLAPVNVDVIRQASTGVQIINNCTLLTSGTGVSVTASSTVKIYGTCQANAAIGAGVTLQIGTLVVDVLVV